MRTCFSGSQPVTAPPDRASSDRPLRGEPVAREVFIGVPGRYDRLAYLLSFGQDRRWRRAVVARTAAGSPRLVLDVATGPAGIALAVAGATGANVAGVDLNEPMLRAGLPRIPAAGRARPGPGRRGPRRPAAVRDATFDAVTFSYLLRYVDDPAATVAEMARCLRPGGTLACLEFSPAAAGLAGRLVVLHPDGAAGARRPHRGPAWYRVGRFLGPSISVHYRQHPLAGTSPPGRRRA